LKASAGTRNEALSCDPARVSLSQGYLLTGPDLLDRGEQPPAWPLSRDILALETIVEMTPSRCACCAVAG
jgi:hypothetical protein